MENQDEKKTWLRFDEAIDDFWNRHTKELNIGKNRSVLIFGSGTWGRGLCSYAKNHSLFDVIGFVDNNPATWNTSIMGITISAPEECYSCKCSDTIFVIATVRRPEDIKIQLRNMGIKENQIRILDVSDYGIIIRGVLGRKLIRYYSVDEDYPSEDRIPVIRSNNHADQRDFRIFIEDKLQEYLDSENGFLQGTLMDLYENIYGSYHNINEFPATQFGNTTAKIMIACSHKDYSPLSEDTSEFYVPIQVGKALTEQRLFYLHDDEGDSISDRNYNYCECTALYWAWKNRFAKDYDYIGLRHYRRKFAISDMQISNLKENEIDIVHLDPIYHADIRFSFLTHTKKLEDWNLMRKAIKKKYPEYLDSFYKYEEQHFICAYNMSIMKREIFDEYCEFLFGVLTEIESFYLKLYDRRDRYLGFLAENLTSVFIIKNRNKYKTSIAKLVPEMK